MTINIKGPELRELKPRILVLGVGGAGGNAINGMINDGLEGVEFVAVNTDAQDLRMSKAPAKIQLGTNLTKQC
jgi:cell division protein FtsZ